MVCIRLGVRYLWVDTLCIIQDDEDLEDWKRESTLMEKVYEGSLLNLFALAASDTEHSLFWKRDPRDVNPVAINDYMIYEMDEDFWRNCVDERPLNLRAWVKQERLLATRNLHFGQEQLLWECAELQAAEAFPSGLPKWVKVPGPPLRHFLKAEPTRGTSSLDVDVYDAWDHLVCEYSKCKVTKGSDKLIAISGLAKRLSKVVKDEYVVGMWRRDLSHGILWYCSEEMDEKKYPGPRRPSEYRAPTFSWASMDAKISMVFFRAYNTKTYIKILDYQLNFVTTDATGLCRGGHLILQCRLQRLIFRHRRKRGGWMSPYKVDLIRPTGTLRSIPRPYLDELTSFFSPVARYDLYAILWTGLEYDLGDTCFPGYYLFLQAVHKEPGTFRRIGLGKTYRDPDVGGYRGMEAGHYPCLSYKDGWHTIRVI
ncbi:heterokaryon incompatibility protein [Apiospora arundinis]|uniref:Heterokaryon incompatibility protein n=1 Tax=Apiospora arundinis TaxID=335852 RepID=A0ABR2IA75_9PEZI